MGRDRTIEAENEGKGISCDAADGCEQGRNNHVNELAGIILVFTM